MYIDIKIDFDFREDLGGKDPDRHSKVLRAYHKQLWTKPLPCGDLFELEDRGRGGSLHYRSLRGEEFSLSSDAVIPTFKWNDEIKKWLSAEELKAFDSKGYTIGGMMIFPDTQINRKWTINQARGCSRRIRDRFDLTLECIRRHYNGGDSPLTAVLARYSSFFELFETFRGYVDFFLLQDLVTANYSAVKTSAPFDNFSGSPIPRDAHEYEAYRKASVDFIDKRNQRIFSENQALKADKV